MKIKITTFALFPVLALLAGCSGSGVTPVASTPTTQSFGSLTTRIVGTAQPPVSATAAGAVSVTGMAGALIDQLTLLFPRVLPPGNLGATKIAFHADRDGNYEIYAMNANGTGQIRLTNNAADDFSPSWSPDGSKIAFSSKRDGNHEIYTMNANGTNQTKITNHPDADLNPSWSPDGSQIAFDSARDGNIEVYVMNADGTNQTRLTNSGAIDYQPSWSPDGRIIFTTDRDQNFEVYVMNSDGTNPRRLTNNPASDGDAVWSPDGSKIAFASYRDGNWEAYTMNPDGSSPVRFTNTPDFEGDFSWSPDSSKLAFTTDRDGNDEVYEMSATASGQANLTRRPSVSDRQPTWSGYLPRPALSLIGQGGTLSATAAGFLFGLSGKQVTGVVSFDTTTIASRTGARVTSQSASETQGKNLIFSITTTAGLASISYLSLDAVGEPGAAVSPTLPAATTGAIVAFDAADGTVAAILPYAANRSASLKPTRAGDRATYAGNFTAVFDGQGKNLAPGGAKSVNLDEKTGKLISFE